MKNQKVELDEQGGGKRNTSYRPEKSNRTAYSAIAIGVLLIVLYFIFK